MVVVHIDTIHGDHLVRAPAAEAFDLAGLAPPSRIVATAPGVSEIRLQRFFGSPVWRAETPEGAKLFDARSGAPLPALTESQVRAQARRSEEHTSELPSLMRTSYAVFCLKKTNTLTS